MKFKVGESGNPSGRPKGAVSKRTQLSKLLEPHAEELINKAVELAKAGDINALRLCLERLIPKPKEETIEITLTDNSLDSPQALLALSTDLIRCTLRGEITLEQTQKLFSLINIQGDAIVMTNLHSRLVEMERILKTRPNNK